MTEQYNQQAIRELITEAFDANELLNMASDLFPNVSRSFAPGMMTDQLIRDILGYATRHGRIEDLLKYTQEHNPHQYNRFEPRLRRPKEIVELEGEVAKQQQVLAKYEELESLETDTESRGKLQENIEKTKNRLLELQTKAAELRKEQQPQLQTPLQSGETVFLANVPYGLETKLVGRESEMLLLDDWFHRDPDHPFLAVIGLGGIGKSALTWDWLQRLVKEKQAPRLVVWWSFYEADGTMQKLLATILEAFGDDPARYVSLRSAVDRCTYYLQRTPALLVLDGAERLLRAYSNMGAAYQADALESGLEFQQARQCIDPAAGGLLQWLAQPGLTQAATLMSSRLLPRELTGRAGLLLAGVRRHDLTGLTADAAVELFRQSGIKAARAEVIAAAEPLGYHPLSLRLLAGYAANDPRNPNDLRAAANYRPDDELLGRRTHILQRAYDSLPPTARETLSRLAAFRGGVEWSVIETVFGGGKKVQNDLTLLEQRGLLQRTVQQRPNHQSPITNYDLHPIVRRYAYDRLANPEATHSQLASYFEAVPQPEKVETLADLGPVIELYHHLARAGQYDDALAIMRDRLVPNPMHFQFGAYQQMIELKRVLFPDGEDKLPRLTNERDQAWILNALASSYSLAGRPSSAVPLFEQQIAIQEKQGNKQSIAIGLGNLAYMGQIPIGALAAADANLRRSIALCREIEGRFYEAIGHQERGRLLAYCGDWEGAAAELDTALEQNKTDGIIQGQGITWVYRALAALLQGKGERAEKAASEALRLADETARTRYPFERDYVQAYWLLGWAALVKGNRTTASQHLDEALRRCRAINLVELEPAILLAQARLARARVVGAGLVPAQDGGGRPQGSPLQEALDYAAEAQLIAERAGYILYLADIHNFLAQLALDANERPAARQHAAKAKEYAWCDGPPYAYQTALDEAERLLAVVG